MLAPEGEVPDQPMPKRNLAVLSHFFIFSLRKCSCSIFHAAPNAGNVPQRLLLPMVELPSWLTVARSTYLLSYEYTPWAIIIIERRWELPLPEPATTEPTTGSERFADALPYVELL